MISFATFLLENNAYDEYVYNRERELRNSLVSDFLKFDEKCPEDFVINAFSWAGSKNNREDFWNEIDNKWKALCSGARKKGKDIEFDIPELIGDYYDDPLKEFFERIKE